MIELRDIDLKDARYISLWKSDSYLAEMLMAKPVDISLKEAEKWIEKNSNDSNQKLFGIYHLDNNLLIGITRLMFIDFNSRLAEFGFYIGNKNVRGKGIGALTLEKTIDYAFSKLKLQKVHLKVKSSNKIAISVYKKIGFVTEGVLKEHYFSNGSYEDILLMAIFKDN